MLGRSCSANRRDVFDKEARRKPLAFCGGCGSAMGFECPTQVMSAALESYCIFLEKDWSWLRLSRTFFSRVAALPYRRSNRRNSYRYSIGPSRIVVGNRRPIKDRTVPQPLIKLIGKRKHRTMLFPGRPVNWQRKILFVALDCPNTTTHVPGDFAPRVQLSVFGHFVNSCLALKIQSLRI